MIAAKYNFYEENKNQSVPTMTDLCHLQRNLKYEVLCFSVKMSF